MTSSFPTKTGIPSFEFLKAIAALSIFSHSYAIRLAELSKPFSWTLHLASRGSTTIMNKSSQIPYLYHCQTMLVSYILIPVNGRMMSTAKARAIFSMWNKNNYISQFETKINFSRVTNTDDDTSLQLTLTHAIIYHFHVLKALT
mgnify:CR=1 FL=1